VVREPVAFLSYVRFDDEHEDGQLSQFRARLSAEVRLQTGVDFPIFQDRNDIAWGQHWQTRVEETLDTVALLIPVVTPSFFRSPACRDECTRFLDRERQLGRQDLILPVYYVGTPELDDAARRDADDLAQTLSMRQYADWRELRFEPMTSPVVRRAIAHLASRLRDTFWHPSVEPVKSAAPMGRRAAVESEASAGHTTSVKHEPPTRVVDAYGRADHTTIGEAIRAARPGDLILVRPGLYTEGVVIDKPLELVGHGPLADVVVQVDGASTLRFVANIGRVANLTLRQTGGPGTWLGVEIVQGRLELEGCDISSQSLSCVGIHSGADPRLRNNRIHGGKECGLLIYDGGLGTLEDNDITGNGYAGVEIRGGGNPTLRRNHIHHNKGSGVHVSSGGLGTLEDNDISSNGGPGTETAAGGDPVVRRNQIRRNKGSGVFVYDNGLGVWEDNDITDNEHTGMEIREGGDPTIRRNQINRNSYEAIWIHDGGRGTFEDNDLTDNDDGPWQIDDADEPHIRRSGNIE
jgi:F-box protein 11